MSEIESGQLILDTTKATSRTLVNTVNTILFKNVNIREVLGDMYDKYDKFKICLNGMQMTGASITDRICFISPPDSSISSPQVVLVYAWVKILRCNLFKFKFL